ncbi:MAG: hypothetical protein WA871_11785 [Candidatus Acidiferrales bacterium]
MSLRIAAIALVALALVAAPRPGWAQGDEEMMPEQSAAKAKALLQQEIAALGGPAYLSVHDYVCEGRLAEFAHSGDINAFPPFKDFWILPDKNRTEWDKKATIVDLFVGNQAWSLDRSGVNSKSAEEIADFQNQVKTDMDNVLRFRLKEDGMTFRYAGADIVDLEQVDWVELVDRDDTTLRFALDASTHLPIRYEVITRNPVTRERSEKDTLYSEYLPIDGVNTPRKIQQSQDGREIYAASYNDCQYNTNLDPNLFTKKSLEDRYAQEPKPKNEKKAPPTHPTPTH